jgi:hypothetical protein
MANEQNLIPNSQRTPEELREMTRKGGIRSGEVRRAKRTFRELIEEYGGLPDENDPRLTNDQAVMISQYKLAKTDKPGSTKAAEFIRDTKGEAPAKNEFNLNANIESITINFGKKDK